MMAADFSGPINLGNPNEMTMLELASKVLALTGSKSKVIFKELPQDDPKQRKPDISLAMQHLGWQPKVDLADGLLATAAYFVRENSSATERILNLKMSYNEFA